MSEGRSEAGYNERLFAGGWRKYLHEARFRWLAATVRELGARSERVFELGCFDGKALTFLPALPREYLGVDADWEGGLSMARQCWAGHPQLRFQLAESSAQVAIPPDQRFDLALAFETLEHLPPHEVDGYLALVARHLDGYLLVTVPNEKGLLFFAKHLTKLALGMEVEPYTLREFIAASSGRMRAVRRTQHKGFDYDALVAQLAERFEVVSVAGRPLGWLPTCLGFTICIVARARSARPLPRGGGGW